MRRKLNVKLLGWVLGSLLVAATVTHFVHGYQVRRNASVLLRQAERALAQGKLSEAVSYYGYYLAYEPGDTDALVCCALTEEKLATTPAGRFRAWLKLQQALRRAPDRDDLRQQVIRLAEDLYRFEEAANELQVLIGKTPDKAELYHRLARCREGLADYSRAADAYRQAMARDRTTLLNYQQLAHLLHVHQERPTEAAKVLDEMVAANPRSWQAYLSRARYRSRFGEAAEAWDDAGHAYQLAPHEPDVLLARAELASSKEAITQARADLRQGLDRHARDLRLYTALARLERQAGQNDAAIVCLRRGLQALPDSVELLVHLTDVLVSSGPLPEAQEAVARLRRQGSEPILTDFFQASLLVRQDQWTRALLLLEQLRPRMPAASPWTVQANLLLSRCYEQLGDTEQQLRVSRLAVALDPTAATARACLGSALLRAARPSEALGELRQAAGSAEPSPKTLTLLGQALLLHNLGLPEEQRDWKDVAEVLEQAERAGADGAEVTVLRAELLVARRQLRAAAELLEQAVARQPKQVLLWTALADLADRQGRFDEAAALLEKARDKAGDQLPLRLAWMHHWLRKGGPQVHEQLARLDVNRGSLTAEEQVRLRRELAYSFYRLGALAEARRLWQQLADQFPGDLHSRLLLFDLALENGQDDAVRRLVADLRRIEGEEGVLWRYGEAVRLLARAGRSGSADLDKVRSYLTELHKRQPQWARVAVLEGALVEAQGNTNAALAYYQKALKQGDLLPSVVERTARMLYDHGRFAEADELLRKVEEVGTLWRDLARLGAELALKNQDLPRAAALARLAVPPSCSDYREQLWLAGVLEAAGKEDEAEVTLRQAARATAAIPDPWVALVRHLARTGQKAKVEEVLVEVRREVPADRLPLTLARCHETVGETDQAERLYRAQQQSHADDFVALRNLAEFYLRTRRPALAEPLLRQLLSPATQAPAEVAARARRQLAVYVAADGRPEHVTEALALLDRNERLDGANVDDGRARAAVLATVPERRREALQLLERSRGRRDLAPDEQFLLAKLCEATGAKGRARELMLSLVTVHGDNADYLAHYSHGLIQRREVVEAQFYLDRLRLIEPNALRTRELTTALQAARETQETQVP